MKSSLIMTAICVGLGVVASGQALAQTETTTQTTKTETKYATWTAKLSATRRDT